MRKPKKEESVQEEQYCCLQCKASFTCPPISLDNVVWFEIDKTSKTMICSIACLRKKRKRHKFNAVKSEQDGITFSSRAERSYYSKLKYEQKQGDVLFFLRQVPFRLPGNTKYVVDYQVFYSDGTVAFIDVKGVSTPMFKLKKKQVEEIYPIIIEVVQC